MLPDPDPEPLISATPQIMNVHYLNLASRYSGSIIVIQQGKVVSAFSPGSLLTSENIAEVYGVKPGEAYTLRFHMSHL